MNPVRRLIPRLPNSSKNRENTQNHHADLGSSLAIAAQIPGIRCARKIGLLTSQRSAELIEDAGLTVKAFAAADPMLQALDPEWAGVVLCDARMAGMDGFAALKAVRAAAPGVPFIMITGHGDVRLAVASIKAGAYDFIEKPVQPDVLLSALKRSVGARKLLLENMRLQSRGQRHGGIRSQILGRSAEIKDLRRVLGEIAALPVTVTVLGEPGTGKMLAAEVLHEHGTGDGTLEIINCATETEQDFAEALARLPDLGTVVFRGADMLTPRQNEHLGNYLRSEDRPRAILTAKDRDALDDGIYYLASGATVLLPPLGDRDKDIFILLEHFLREAAKRFGKPLPMTTKDMLAPMHRYTWPGNVRELRAVAERLVIGLPSGLEDRKNADKTALHYDEAMQRFERELLEQALRETAGRKGDAAELLSIPRKRLYLRMKAVGLLEPGHK